MTTLFIIHLAITLLFIFLYVRVKRKNDKLNDKFLKELKDIQFGNNQHFEEYI